MVSGEVSVSGEIFTAGRPFPDGEGLLMLYIDYQKGSEDSLEIQVFPKIEGVGEFERVDSSLNNPIPPLTKTSRPAIPVPVVAGEETLVLKAFFTGDTSSPGIAKIYGRVVA